MYIGLMSRMDEPSSKVGNGVSPVDDARPCGPVRAIRAIVPHRQLAKGDLCASWK
jgi:hypothetical protein